MAVPLTIGSQCKVDLPDVEVIEALFSDQRPAKILAKDATFLRCGFEDIKIHSPLVNNIMISNTSAEVTFAVRAHSYDSQPICGVTMPPQLAVFIEKVDAIVRQLMNIEGIAD